MSCEAENPPPHADVPDLQQLQSHGLSAPPAPSNPALNFPCLDKLESRSAQLSANPNSRTSSSSSSTAGPEPSYTSGVTLNYHCKDPLLLDWGGILPSFNIAYESWGALNADRSNVILLHTGLSASSHAHSTEANPAPGWWEKFIGPGAPPGY
ncbi:uncharacterized protein TrAtP1_012168 [Trichoderma atroviride]|uniref:uncharacterized protein n=1 Tax=Hypocrea atroviridis TaxID=63577 RepID=UPI0033243BC7|nr:hypothetical protein TrAtP1_012168 [Trichoderma atroviride]